MALLNTGCLISTIQEDVTGITTGYAADCFTVIAAGVDGVTQDRCVTVPTSGSLPSLWPTQSVPQGQVVFVEDVGVPVIAASGKWIGFDQRVLRYDCPTTELYSWGHNTQGQLGDGTTTQRSSPVTVLGKGLLWCAVSTYSHTLALKNDKTLWSWGINDNGRLGNGNTIDISSPATVIGGGSDWCQISAGGIHSAAIKTDGTLWTWGGNSLGALGTGNTTSRSSPGTVSGGGTSWCMVSAGGVFTAAIKTDGTLWTWGQNLYGELGDGTTTARCSPATVAGGGSNWCSVESGNYFVLALKTDGTLWTWGRNTGGQLGDGTTTSRCSPGTVAGGGTSWCQISAGGGTTSGAIKNDGSLWMWGSNFCGILGDGSSPIIFTSKTSPVTVAGGGSNWSKVSVGENHVAAIKSDGTVWSWGSNTCRQIGDATSDARCSPVTTSGGGTNWNAISAGQYFSIGIRTL